MTDGHRYQSNALVNYCNETFDSIGDLKEVAFIFELRFWLETNYKKVLGMCIIINRIIQNIENWVFGEHALNKILPHLRVNYFGVIFVSYVDSFVKSDEHDHYLAIKIVQMYQIKWKVVSITNSGSICVYTLLFDCFLWLSNTVNPIKNVVSF